MRSDVSEFDGTLQYRPDMPCTAPIGGGESADVFREDRATVLKLFFPHVALHTVDREYVASKAASILGLLVAQPVRRIRTPDRYGLVMQFLDGPVYLHKVARNPLSMTWALFALARWHKRLHAQPAPGADLPNAREIFAHRLISSVVAPSAIAAAQRVVAAYPEGVHLCHGDFHLGNMIATSDGLATIDWAKAFIGMPETDVARSELLIRYGKYGRLMRRFPPVRVMRHISAEWYLFCYCTLSRRKRRDIMRWRLPVAVAWMQGQHTMFVPGLSRAITRMARRFG